MSGVRRMGGTRARASGFVLAVTLWILAAIAVIAALVSVWAIEGVRDAATVQAEADDAVAAYGTAQTAIYLLATRDKTIAGLPTVAIDRAKYAERMLEDMGALRVDPVGGEMRLDDQAYIGLEGAAFSIQDAAGLLGLTWPVALSVDQALAAAPELAPQATRLRDTLLDYIDEDDEVRPFGAERNEYRSAGRESGPPNRKLLSPLELSQVLGWEKVPRPALARMEAAMTVRYLGPLNINTVPANALAALLPGCPALCESWVQGRSREPYLDHYQLENRLAVDLPRMVDDYYRTVADTTQRITVWDRHGRGWRWDVQTTPMADKSGPWTILAVYPFRHGSKIDAQSTGSPLFAKAQAGRD